VGKVLSSVRVQVLVRSEDDVTPARFTQEYANALTHATELVDVQADATAPGVPNPS
jgi:hypothetical protein